MLGEAGVMTEVIAKGRWLAGSLGLLVAVGSVSVKAQQKEQIPSPSTNIRIQTATPPGQQAEELYLKLRSVGLDPQRVYHIREGSLDREQIHMTFDDGTIGFTKDVDGHVTGAFFEGDGEILVVPPGQSERASMVLFTKSAILEEDFATAYFRFNDNTFAELQPYLRPTEEAQEFVTKWDQAARNLAEGDALRLFVTFSQDLPIRGAANTASAPANNVLPDRLLHARLQSDKLGIFDVYYDSHAAEQIAIAQAKSVESGNYYNVWASFSPPGSKEFPDEIDIQDYKIQAQVTPPTNLKATTRVRLQVLRGGGRTLLFELSRNLKVSELKADGQPLELIQNQALEGTALARRGNDLFAAVFPQPLKTGQKIELELSYAGDVLSEAGGGLLYVGARGIWYPNRGLSAANFDLQFRYPPGWTLLATGRRVEENAIPDQPAASTPPTGMQSSHWVTDKPIPIAGFNLGRYERATASSNGIAIETYAARGVEKTFPKAQEQVVEVPPIRPLGPNRPTTVVVTQPPPSPARNAQVVADTAAQAVNFYAERFGPYPYSSLEITQMPGLVSQGWPGLIFLSSYAFLTPEERRDLHLDPVTMILDAQVTAHETAHQWWGDLVYWRSYRDQWIGEALASYCALMILESENPIQFRLAMTRYRDNLLVKNKSGAELKDAGPVTLGIRLSSSEFPDGYEAISYGRGTWLVHMLRHLLDDGVARDSSGATPFVRALRNIRERYAGKPMTTRQMLDVFSEELPESVRYEGKQSLDWFYEQWINGTAVPRFQLQGVKLVPKGSSVSASGTIVQKDAPKELVTSVPIYAVLAGERRVFAGRIFADGPENSFHLSAPAGTRKLIVDPGETVLRDR
jgi:hypothetical protein